MGDHMYKAIYSTIDWVALGQETVLILQDLIRFKTVNPPGDELLITQYLQQKLNGEGVESVIVQPSSSRAGIVARIRGDGTRRPVMLAAHTDVVDVEYDKWSVPPFDGVIQDGYLYGRGAIDNKGMLAIHLAVTLQIARLVKSRGLSLSRDIVFLAAPDEETGGELGVGWMIDNHADLFDDCEFALNEGGRIRVAEDGSRSLLLQTAEKISHKVIIAAKGPPGHAGVPRADNSILTLAKALTAIADYASDPLNGVSPTILSGGNKYNVIPSQSSALLNIRTRPDQNINVIIEEVRGLIATDAVTVTLEERGVDAPASPEGSDFYNAIVESVRSLDPDITVQPYLSNGITDSARFRRIGIQAYGVLPFPLTPEDESRMHGHDERVSVAGLEYGVRLVCGALFRIS